MKKAFLIGSSITAALFLSACATQAPPVAQVEAPQSTAAQKKAQQSVQTMAPASPTLKHKIALGRITNETNYGRSLLRDSQGDPLGKQVTDLMSKALTETNAYIVLERPDISRIQAEGAITGKKQNLIGVDVLINRLETPMRAEFIVFGLFCGALFTGDPTTASLKVSFFGPFYGGYHVVALDQQNYRWAMVAGPDRDYLWILARDKQLPAGVRDVLLEQAGALGFAVDKLIWVGQTRVDG